MEDNVALAAAEAIPGPSTSADITPTISTTSPRSHRVYTRPSPLFTTTSSSAPSPPSLPLRSPLRPPPRSISTSTQSSSTVSHSNSAVASSNTSTLTLDSPVSPQTPTDDLASISDLTLLPAHFQMRDRHNSFPSLNGLIDPLVLVDDEKQMQRPSLLNLNLNGVTVDLLSKELPERPETPLSINLEDDSILESNVDNNTNTTAPTSVASSHHPPPPTMSKRHHAMHELLSSERAYASDLALIREVHIPLALGHTAMLQSVPVSPPSSGSGSSTRTVSTSSDSSTASLGPPMAPEDVKVIFSNIEELAILSDMFAEKLEFALGNVVEGGQGDDYIGALFLECVPLWERPYKQYITRHPSALQHLQSLPQTPALAAYLSYTQRVASELSHAWDLASLLIKPVQRLLKYPLLLNTIIDETADAHPDKENLRAARERIEELARNVNEGRRRAEVVKDVLTSKGGKKPSAPVGVSASVSLSKVKSLRHGGVTAATMRASALAAANGNGDGGAEGGNGGGGEAAQVEAMQAELKQIEVFAQQFARNVVDWGKMMSNMMLALRTWALSFGKVIGLSADQRSEAFEAFVDVVRQKLMPLSADLEAAINERLLKDMAHLLMTMNQPLKLLASMNEQEPYHYHLLTMPVSQKNRPPASLLAASTNYLALRGQLAAELPAYLRLLHRGFQIFVLRLAGIQTRFWKDVKEHWAELWEMLRVESELNVGWEETCAVWCARWADVDEVVKALGVALPVPHVQPTPRTYYYTYQYPAASSSSVPSTATATATPPAAQTDFAEYFAYPGYYMPMTPNFSTPPPPTTTKNRRESESSGNSGSKLEKLNSKSSGHSNGNSKTTSTGGAGAAAVTVQSMFAALEPAHSPVHKKSSISSYSTPAGASTSTTNVVSGSGPGYAPSLVTGSMFGGGASMYSVSGPLPLGSVPIPVHRDREREREKDGRKERDRDRERGRGRGASDASALPSSKNGSGSVGGSYNHSPNGNGNGNGNGRRPSSQDGAHIRAAATAAAGAGGGARTPPARRRTQGHGMAEEFAEYVALHGQGGMMPPPYGGAQYPYSPPAAGSGGGGGGRESSPSPRQGITRMKSMPLSLSQTQANGGRYVVDGERDHDRAHYQTSTPNGAEESWEDYQVQQQQQQQQQQYPSETTTIRQSERGRDRDRDRETETRRLTKPHRPVESSPKRKSKEHARKRSGSVKSITSFFTGAPASANPTSNPNAPAPPPDPQPLTASQRDSWVSKPAKYICQVIHPCKPPASVAYYSFPFFTLKEGALYEVLQEAGHPSIHPKLPLYVDDGEDCLLLCRDGNGVVGWALASFLEPLSIGG